MPAPEIFAGMYDEGYTASLDAAKASRALAPVYFRKIRRFFPSSPFRFLEIGGSYGFLAALVKQRTGAAVTLLEPGARATEAATGLGIEVARGYAENYRSAEPFDVVFAAHVVEHVTDVGSFVRACADLLKPGGRLILITPNACAWKLQWFRDGWSWSAPAEHTHFLSPAAARAIFSRNGFSTVDAYLAVPSRTHYPFFLTRALSFALTQLIGRQSSSAPAPVSPTKGVDFSAAPVRGWKYYLRRSGRVILWTEYLTLSLIDRLMGRARMDELMIVAQHG